MRYVSYTYHHYQYWPLISILICLIPTVFWQLGTMNNEIRRWCFQSIGKMQSDHNCIILYLYPSHRRHISNIYKLTGAWIKAIAVKSYSFENLRRDIWIVINIWFILFFTHYRKQSTNPIIHSNYFNNVQLNDIDNTQK